MCVTTTVVAAPDGVSGYGRGGAYPNDQIACAQSSILLPV